MASSVDLNDLAALLVQANAQRADVVPDGWLTARQWAKKWDCKLAWAAQCLTRLRESDMVEVKKFRIQTIGRGLFLIPHYKINEAPKA